MIRLRTVMIVLVIPCFFFVQGGFTPVYSEGGVPQNFQNYINTLTGILKNPSLAQDLTLPSSTSTPSGLTTSTSTYPNTNQTPYPPYDTPEHTIELIVPMNFNSLTGNEPLLPMAESYTVTVCVSYNNMAVSDCRDKKTPLQAGQILAAMILNKYLNGVEIRPFRVVLPSAAPLTEQNQLLRKIETEAIAIIEARMLNELKKSKIFLSESEKGRQQRLNIITQDAKRALQEADSGANWTHTIKNDRTSHDFQTAAAFKQFINNMSVAELKSQSLP
jgi:hypothetical protein